MDSSEFLENLASRQTMLLTAGVHSILIYSKGANQSKIGFIEKKLKISLPEKLKELFRQTEKLTFCWDKYNLGTGAKKWPVDSGGLVIDINEIEILSLDIFSFQFKRILQFGYTVEGNNLVYDLEKGTIYLHEAKNKLTCISFSIEGFFQYVIKYCGAFTSEEHKQKEIEDLITMIDHSSNKKLITATDIFDRLLLFGGGTMRKERQLVEARYNEIFEILLQKIVEKPDCVKWFVNEFKNFDHQLLCHEVILLWDKPLSEDLMRARSLITSCIFPPNKAFQLIISCLEKDHTVDGERARKHLCELNHTQVIKWMEEKISYPIYDWVLLFIAADPTTEQLSKWKNKKSQIHKDVALLSELYKTEFALV